MIDYYHRKIPEYYPTMYLDSYTPTEVYIAGMRMAHRHAQEALEARKAKAQEQIEIIVKSEVKVK